MCYAYVLLTASILEIKIFIFSAGVGRTGTFIALDPPRATLRRCVWCRQQNENAKSRYGSNTGTSFCVHSAGCNGKCLEI